jgi:hypothetical protein
MAERTQDDAVSEAGRQLVARRWGNTAVVRSAEVVIARHAELPESVRAELHQVTGPPGGEPSDRG